MEKNWIKEIHEIYQRMEKDAQENPEIIFKGLKIKLDKGVYSPHFFTDSDYFSRELPKIVNQDSLLEIGTGTGVLGMVCALNGASVIITDINPSAIEVARENIKKNNLQIDIREGDIYSPIKKEEKFDFIFWSHPYNNWPEPVEDMLLRSGFDYNYESLRKYIGGAKEHLKENGKLLLGTGNSADLATIVKIAHENNYSVTILNAENMPLADNQSFRIINMILQFEFNDKKRFSR